MLLFSAVGFVGAAGAGTFLWLFVGPEHSLAVLGVRHPWLFSVFPVAGATLAAIWSGCFNASKFGAAQGALVAFLAFLSFCALLSPLVGAGLWGFAGFSVFGFILFGWLLVLLGALAGHYFRGTRTHGAL
jgi:hypothetical protein